MEHYMPRPLYLHIIPELGFAEVTTCNAPTFGLRSAAFKALGITRNFELLTHDMTVERHRTEGYWKGSEIFHIGNGYQNMFDDSGRNENGNPLPLNQPINIFYSTTVCSWSVEMYRNTKRDRRNVLLRIKQNKKEIDRWTWIVDEIMPMGGVDGWRIKWIRTYRHIEPNNRREEKALRRVEVMAEEGRL